MRLNQKLLTVCIVLNSVVPILPQGAIAFAAFSSLLVQQRNASAAVLNESAGSSAGEMQIAGFLGGIRETLNEGRRTVQEIRGTLHLIRGTIQEVEGLENDLLGNDDQKREQVASEKCDTENHRGRDSICTPSGSDAISDELKIVLERANLEGLFLSKGGGGSVLDSATNQRIRFSIIGNLDLQNVKRVMLTIDGAKKALIGKKVYRVDFVSQDEATITFEGGSPKMVRVSQDANSPNFTQEIGAQF